jgi:hypothetical protein
MLKKIAKSLDELAKNEELMGEILAAAEEDLEGMNGGGDGGMMEEDGRREEEGGEYGEKGDER